MIFTIHTYAAAHRRMNKKRRKLEKQAKISPMAVDQLYKAVDLHERILERLDREIEDWEWV